MANKTLSIAIPTYNRSGKLENLLSKIAPEAAQLKGKVQICVSNNGSKDNTRGVVMSFYKKYPDIIKYNENEKNLGIDINLIKVMEMAEGQFIWLLGDDDMIADDGIKKVVHFINNNCNENTGLVILSNKSYFIDEETGTEKVYFDSFQGNMPVKYEINPKEVIGVRLSFCFLSVLLFNNNLIKRLLVKEVDFIKKAIGSHYVHVFLYNLLFLNYPNSQIIKFNKRIIHTNMEHIDYKFYTEDQFELYYAKRVKLIDLLLSIKNISSEYRNIMVIQKREFMRGFIREMVTMKAFGLFYQLSYPNCILLFFKESSILNATVFSAFFITVSAVPSFVLRNFYKFFTKIKHKKGWKQVWSATVTNYAGMSKSKGERRLISDAF